jgi:predicted nucleotidyltransferase component of viral defense system
LRNIYDQQVELLIKCLPLVNQIKYFALKGGTAINLLARDDYPRASIDIDLTYINIEDRKKSLSNIENGLITITKKKEQLIKLEELFQ